MKPDVAILALVVSIYVCFTKYGLCARTLLPPTIPTQNATSTTLEEEANFALSSSCMIAKNIFVSELGADNAFVYSNVQTGKPSRVSLHSPLIQTFVP